MRLLYIHQHFSTPNGSAGTRSYEFARHMVARRHHVVMVCGSYSGGQSGLATPFVRGKRTGTVDGIEVVEFNLAYGNHQSLILRSILFARFAVRSTLLALTEKYDVVFATTTPLTTALPGLAARWLRGKRFVFEVRDLWPELPRAMGVIKNRFVLAALSALEWCAYKSADRLIGLAPGIVDGIALRGPNRNCIALVPNGCDLHLFDTLDEKARLPGVSEKALLAVFCGTHGLANGLGAVLDAAGELRRRGRDDIHFALIGNGAQKKLLQARAASEALANVSFHHPVAKRELASLLAGADVGLQILADVPAFYFGTSPNKFFDYLAASLPVLNNYPGWVAQMVTENHCGWAVSPGNPVAFADALIDAAEHREETRLMGQRALELARSSFDREQLAAKWGDWVEGVLSC
jgi:glycosyltransferase involved in cell wall biosynthesis